MNTPTDHRQLVYEIALLAEAAFRRGFEDGFTTAQKSPVSIAPGEVRTWRDTHTAAAIYPPPILTYKELTERHAPEAADFPLLEAMFKAVMRLPPEERTPPPTKQENAHHDHRTTNA